MDNPEEVLHSLDEFAKFKPKSIPRELEDYLVYVARTGDPVYQWPVVKCLFREKLLNVITEFYETTPTLDLTPSPNVDPFNYESMKSILLERLEAFSNAPFTVQRLCELLTTPRKEYNRPDKFMRAIEKNILVVSTREPGGACRPDSALSEPIQNGVSEPSEANSSEDITAQTSIESEAKHSGENHVASEGTSLEQSNHVDSEQPGPSLKVTTDAEESKQEETSESLTREDKETPETTELSDSVIDGEVSSVTEDSIAAEVVNVVTPDSASNSEMIDQPEESSVSASDSQESDGSPVMCTSSDVTSVGDEEQKTYEGDLTEKDNEGDLTEKDDIVPESESKEEPASDSEQVSSEAEPEPSGSTDKVQEEEKTTKEEVCEPSETEPAISSEEPEQLVDSTALDPEEEKDAATSDSDSGSSSEPVVSTEADLDSEPKTTIDQETLQVSEGSEATPAVEEESKSVAKENIDAVKSDVDASITSTETNEEEAMDVDEGSNQQAEAADGDAMDVAVEDEPMEVCEELPLPETTTTLQETPQ